MPQEGAMRGPRGGTRTDILSPSPKAEPRDRQQAPQRHQRPHDPPKRPPESLQVAHERHPKRPSEASRVLYVIERIGYLRVGVATPLANPGQPF